MCGIAGFVDLKRQMPQDRLRQIGHAMGERIAHRGPDSWDCWADETVGVSFAHRRLSIIELSPSGAQPMSSSDGRYVVVFNGEIYNFEDLRVWVEAAAGRVWRGRSDTEVMLEALSLYGIEATLQRCNGMFAIALWDRQEHTLTLARDRIGEKPLYYGLSSDTFLFGSELKAFRAHPSWRGRMDSSVLPSYLRFGYVPAPRTIYEGIWKLPPGTFATVPLAKLGEPLVPAPYWTFPKPNPTGMDPVQAVDELQDLLRASIRRQTVSDVPLGAFLSGGIDSSVVTAMMQEQSSRPVRSFSIGFDDPALNEAPHAKAIATHIGTEHTELYVSARQAMDLAPSLGEIYDEPFADSSQIPTTLLARLVRDHVTVALSGDAGDELFGGYVRYDVLQQFQAFGGGVPEPLRGALAKMIGVVPLGPLRFVTGLVSKDIAARVRPDQISRVQRLLRMESGQTLYRNLMSQISEPGHLISAPERSSLLDNKALWNEIGASGPWAAYTDALTYLPDDILVKVDRASMASSLEVRVPLLDPDIIALASRVDWKTKTHDGQLKWPLKTLLERYVPRSLFDRPKMGFGVPLGAWLRGDLRSWAEEILRSDVGPVAGHLDAVEIQRLWDDHLSGRQDSASALWTILMLKDWSLRNV